MQPVQASMHAYEKQPIAMCRAPAIWQLGQTGAQTWSTHRRMPADKQAMPTKICISVTGQSPTRGPTLLMLLLVQGLSSAAAHSSPTLTLLSHVCGHDIATHAVQASQSHAGNACRQARELSPEGSLPPQKAPFPVPRPQVPSSVTSSVTTQAHPLYQALYTPRPVNPTPCIHPQQSVYGEMSRTTQIRPSTPEAARCCSPTAPEYTCIPQALTKEGTEQHVLPNSTAQKARASSALFKPMIEHTVHSNRLACTYVRQPYTTEHQLQ